MNQRILTKAYSYLQRPILNHIQLQLLYAKMATLQTP